MDLGLAKEFLVLLGAWGLFLGVFLIFLRSSSQETPPPLESNAANPLEKRLFQRKRLPWVVSFSVLDRPDYQGNVLSRNISKGGLCIPLAASLQLGSRLRLSIQLPRVKRPLSVWGEVVWQSSLLTHPSNRFETGIRFIQLNPSHILTIARSL